MPSTGIVCGSRSVPKHEVEEQSRRIAGGLAAIDVRQGDCVAILMRNDIAFLTASYGAMMLGAYAVPINWHFAAEEIAYIFGDSGAKVLIGHADLLTLHGIAAASRIPVVCAETPPEIVAAYGIDPALLALPAGAIAFEFVDGGPAALCGAATAAAAKHDLHLGHHGAPQGCAPPGADGGRTGEDRNPPLSRVRHKAGGASLVAGPALPLGAEFLRHPGRGASARFWC